MAAARSKKKTAAKKKTTAKKPAARKTAAKKAPAKKTTAKKKAPAKKAPAKKAVAKKAPPRKPAARKAPAKKAVPEEAGPRKPEPPRRKAGSPGFGVSPAYLAALPEYEKGMALLQQREFSQAEAQFESLIAAFPSVNDLVDRARTYISVCQKQREEARTLDGFDDLYYHGVYLGNRGDYDEALLHLNKALELEPDSPKVHYSIASVLCLQGERDRALQSLGRAVELDQSTRIYAKNDPDLQSLHGDPEFNQLVGVAEGQTVG